MNKSKARRQGEVCVYHVTPDITDLLETECNNRHIGVMQYVCKILGGNRVGGVSRRGVRDYFHMLYSVPEGILERLAKHRDVKECVVDYDRMRGIDCIENKTERSEWYCRFVRDNPLNSGAWLYLWEGKLFVNKHSHDRNRIERHTVVLVKFKLPMARLYGDAISQTVRRAKKDLPKSCTILPEKSDRGFFVQAPRRSRGQVAKLGMVGAVSIIPD